MPYRILTINPGSSSVKLGCVEDGKELFPVNVFYDTEKLKPFSAIHDQLDCRRETLLI